MLIYPSLLSLFISCSNALVEYIDMCLALDRKRPIGKKFPCKADKDCGCGNGERPDCLGGQCWCFSPPSSANKHT